MSTPPSNLKYTKEHEWVRVEGNHATVGITQFAQQQLGEVVFVELPEVGQTFSADEELGTVESVKAVSEIFSPVSGKVVEVNTALADSPESLNDEPYGEGWLVKLELSDSKEVAGLMDAAAYEAYTKEEQ
jgi:glycine cleavage system H protein